MELKTLSRTIDNEVVKKLRKFKNASGLNSNVIVQVALEMMFDNLDANFQDIVTRHNDIMSARSQNGGKSSVLEAMGITPNKPENKLPQKTIPKTGK